MDVLAMVLQGMGIEVETEASRWERSNKNPGAIPRRVLAGMGAAALEREKARLFPNGPAPEVEQAICPTCGQFGYISKDLPVGHPEFGKLFPCPDPNCPIVAQRRAERTQRIQGVALKNSDFAASYKDYTFESFGALVQSYKGRLGIVDGSVVEMPEDKNWRDGNGKPLDAWTGKKGGASCAYAFAVSGGQPFTKSEAATLAKFDKHPNDDGKAHRSVVLCGEPGFGKTALAAAAFNHLVANGQQAIFTRMYSISSRFIQAYRSSEDVDALLSVYVNVPYLIIDEFKLENSTEDRREKVEEIVRGRDRLGLPTLYTTNSSLSEMEATMNAQIADIVRKAHWMPVAGVKLRVVTKTATVTW